MCGSCEELQMGGEACPNCGNNPCTCDTASHEGSCPDCGSKSCEDGSCTV